MNQPRTHQARKGPARRPGGSPAWRAGGLRRARRGRPVPPEVVRPLRAQRQGRALHAAREGRAGHPLRRAGRGPRLDRARSTGAACSTARRASACRSTGSRWTRCPEILRRLEATGLTTTGACGDVTRNVVGCTLAGIAHDEIVDGYATALALHERFLGNRAFSNLPRKYKISVTGCAQDCARGLINDIALSGAIDDDGRRGFNLRVGGGLSAVPRFARWIDVFLTPEEAPEVVEHVTAIFRDSEPNRKARGKARLKFLLDGMGPEAFRDRAREAGGRPLRRGAAHAPDLQGHDHIGVTAAARRGAFRGRPLRARRAGCAASSSRRARAGARVRHGRGAAHPPAEHPHPARARTSGSTRSWPSRSCATSCRPSRRCSRAACRPAPARSSAGSPRSTRRSAPRRSPRSSTSMSAPTGTARTCACTSPAARRAAPSTRSPTSASRASSSASTARWSRRWTSGSAGASGPDPRFGEVVVKKVPHWELNDQAAGDLRPLRAPPPGGRDVPRVRGPDRGGVVGAAADRAGGRRGARVAPWGRPACEACVDVSPRW